MGGTKKVIGCRLEALASSWSYFSARFISVINNAYGIILGMKQILFTGFNPDPSTSLRMTGASV